MFFNLNNTLFCLYRPIYVDLDVGQGQLSIPGTIGAMAIERPADVEEGFSQVCPLIYHYGYKEPGCNVMLYNLLVTKLAQTVAERMEANRQSRRENNILPVIHLLSDFFFKFLFRCC